MKNSIGKSFLTRYTGLVNSLRNNVGIYPADDSPQKVDEKWVSIWDTGATRSVITKKVVDELCLKPISMSRAKTPQGEYSAYQYLIDLYLPNRVVFPNLLVMEGCPFGCDILIGMDVIGTGDFAVSNHDGKTSFSFRFPSCTEIDFVNHSYLQPVTKKESPNAPAKNSLCPCGSGKKYKQCCGKGKF